MRENRVATVWIPVDDIRISPRRRRSMSDVKVECYRLLLEQGFQPAPGAPGTER